MQDSAATKIIELLEAITIQNDRIIEQNNQIEDKIGGIEKKIEKLQQALTSPRQVSVKSEASAKAEKPRAFKEGDKVIITNPNKGQDPKGEIIGFTIIGHPKIKTSKEITRRAPHNIILDPEFHEEK